MREKVRTIPNLAETSPAHLDAIEKGLDHFGSWQYNVEDRFKALSKEEIKAELRRTAFPYAVCFENLINDFNISCSMRSANAFNAKEIFYIGDKKFDRRGLVGIQNYSTITWIPTIEDFLNLKLSYKIVGFDNVEGAVPLDTYSWEENTLMVFGSESVGLSQKMLSMCDSLVYIKQFGSIRSLNVATASGIIMHDFVTKYKVPTP